MKLGIRDQVVRDGPYGKDEHNPLAPNLIEPVSDSCCVELLVEGAELGGGEEDRGDDGGDFLAHCGFPWCREMWDKEGKEKASKPV